MPSLNGYGTLEGTLSHKEGNTTVPQSVTVDTAAESFVRDGLSKVMKITNICDSEHLTDCGLPDKIIPINNGSAITLSSISTMSGLNAKLIQASSGTEQTGKTYYEMLNTKAGAFETVNGESVLVYYNPNCESDLGEIVYKANTTLPNSGYFVQPKLCANFIYDLNGKKGPNTVGKDIGTITVLYSTDPVIISPNPYPNDTTNGESPDDITEKCKDLGENAKVATIDELSAMFVNYKLYNFSYSAFYRSITKLKNHYWLQSTYSGVRWINDNQQCKVRCVKRN